MEGGEAEGEEGAGEGVRFWIEGGFVGEEGAPGGFGGGVGLAFREGVNEGWILEATFDEVAFNNRLHPGVALESGDGIRGFTGRIAGKVTEHTNALFLPEDESVGRGEDRHEEGVGVKRNLFAGTSGKVGVEPLGGAGKGQDIEGENLFQVPWAHGAEGLAAFEGVKAVNALGVATGEAGESKSSSSQATSRPSA